MCSKRLQLFSSAASREKTINASESNPKLIHLFIYLIPFFLQWLELQKKLPSLRCSESAWNLTNMTCCGRKWTRRAAPQSDTRNKKKKKQTNLKAPWCPHSEELHQTDVAAPQQDVTDDRESAAWSSWAPTLSVHFPRCTCSVGVRQSNRIAVCERVSKATCSPAERWEEPAEEKNSPSRNEQLLCPIISQVLFPRI